MADGGHTATTTTTTTEESRQNETGGGTGSEGGVGLRVPNAPKARGVLWRQNLGQPTVVSPSAPSSYGQGPARRPNPTRTHLGAHPNAPALFSHRHTSSSAAVLQVQRQRPRSASWFRRCWFAVDGCCGSMGIAMHRWLAVLAPGRHLGCARQTPSDRCDQAGIGRTLGRRVGFRGVGASGSTKRRSSRSQVPSTERLVPG